MVNLTMTILLMIKMLFYNFKYDKRSNLMQVLKRLKLIAGGPTEIHSIKNGMKINVNNI